MVNTTAIDAAGEYDETLRAALIACQVINIALLGLSIYSSACVVVYGWKTNSWKKRKVGGMDRGKIYTMCLFAMVSDIPRLVLSEIVFNVNDIPEAMEHCEEIMDVTNMAYFVAIFPKYLFLWYRQHTINSHPASIRLISEKWMKIASYSVLVLMTFILILLATFYMTYSFIYSPFGCIFDAFEEPPTSILDDAISRDYIIASGFIMIEVMLLTLFVYPLYRSYQSKRKLQKNLLDVHKNTPHARRTSNPEGKHNDCLRNLMKRSTIAAFVVVIFDLVVMIVAIHTPPDRPAIFLVVTYNVRNAIHAICILSSFSLYRQILTILFSDLSRKRGLDSVMETSEREHSVY